MARVVSIGAQDFMDIISTTYEVRQTFEELVLDWFDRDLINYNGFIKALRRDNVEEMNEYMNQIEEKRYEQMLVDKVIDKGRIRKYGCAFEGKKC